MPELNDILAKLATQAGLAFAIAHLAVFSLRALVGFYRKHGWDFDKLEARFTQDIIYQALPGVALVLLVPDGFPVGAAIVLGSVSGVVGKGFAAELRKIVMLDKGGK